jgi:hypothetical protein
MDSEGIGVGVFLFFYDKAYGGLWLFASFSIKCRYVMYYILGRVIDKKITLKEK